MQIIWALVAILCYGLIAYLIVKYRKYPKRIEYNRVINEGKYMLDRERIFCEDYPDEFISQNVFNQASLIVACLVEVGIGGMSMGHCGYTVDIHCQEDELYFLINISETEVSGFAKLPNYEVANKNHIKFTVELSNEYWLDVVVKSIQAAKIACQGEREKCW